MRTFIKINYLTLGSLAVVVLGVFMLYLPVLAQDISQAEIEVSSGRLSGSSTLQVANFIKKIWRESPRMQGADARLNAVRNQVKADSKWLYNPELELTFEDTEGEDKTRLVGISQTIDWNGKYRAAGAVAKFELQAAIAEYENIRQGIATDSLMALADYQSAKAILALSLERTGLMERFASLESKSFKTGDIDQSEYNLAQLAFSEALIQHADAESTLAENRLALVSASGFSVEPMVELPALPDRLPEISMNRKSVDEVITRLPAIRMLQNRGKASRASITRARRDRLADPTVSLTGGEDAGARLIGVSVSIPLNIINTFNAEVEVARHEATVQEKSLQSALYIAKSRIESSRNKYELSNRAWKVWKKRGSKALEQQVDTLDSKFKVGELSATEYLVQVQQTLDTRIAAEELRSKVWKAWFAWIKVSGSVEQWLQGE